MFRTLRCQRWPGFVCLVALLHAAVITDRLQAQANHGNGFVGETAGQIRSDNAVKMRLVWCPAGNFKMGSPKSEKGRHDNEESVEVRLSKGFWLGQFEVTQAQWQSEMRTTPWNDKVDVKEGDTYPATFVNWDDAMRFCDRLTETERDLKRLPSDWMYTLPTEAQWERACRSGTTTRFSFGDSDSEFTNYGWSAKNTDDAGEKYAHMVGQKKANQWGLCDMHGNVAEWCHDWQGKRLSGGVDPLGPSVGLNRVVRGGNWIEAIGSCRSASRLWSKPSSKYNFVGFRVAAVSYVKQQ